MTTKRAPLVMGIKSMYYATAVPVLREEFGFTNEYRVPRIVKVTVHTGTGRMGKEFHEHIIRSLAAITGQRPVPRCAKKSIASFGTRKGAIIGFQCTLRGERMYDFITRLVGVALPRTRDFRGIPEQSFDSQGNLSVGIREHTVFPEVTIEDVRSPFGLEVTVTTNARTREEGVALLRALGFPIQGATQIRLPKTS